MATKLFVAGLSYSMTDTDLSNLFAEYGTVASAQIITDRETNRSKGFGFIEMSSEDESKNAIQGLNGKEIDGRALTVNEARPREDRPSRPSNGGYNDHRGGGGGNNRRSYR